MVEHSLHVLTNFFLKCYDYISVPNRSRNHQFEYNIIKIIRCQYYMRLKCKLEPKAYNNLLIMKFKVFTFFTLATEPLVSKDSVFLVGIRLA